MKSKIFLLAFPIFFSGVLAQVPTGLSPNFASNLVPSLPGVPSVSVSNGVPSISTSGGHPPLPANGGIPSIPSIPSLPSPGGAPTFPPNGGLFPSLPFPGILNPNWSRPSLSSTSPIWQKYFKQLQEARKELLQSLNNNNNNQDSNKTGAVIRAQNPVKIPTPPPLLPGQGFQFLPQIQNAISQFINQWRPPPNGRPQRLFPGNNPLAFVLPPGGPISQLENNNNNNSNRSS